MANNRELSQFGSYVTVDDTNKTVGIATTVNITAGGLYVGGVQVIRSDGNLTTPSGVGIQTGSSRIGTGFTDINFIGSGITAIGSGSTVTITVTATTSAGGGSGEFNTGITSSVAYTPLAYETTAFTFPSTAGKRYVIESMHISNVAIADTEVNIIASITDSEQTYIAYNVPIESGGAIELLKQPIVANPSNVIKVWATDYSYVGTGTGTQMYISYSEFDNTDYIVGYGGAVSIATTEHIGIYTATGTPSVIQSILLVNRTDNGDYPVSVTITNGLTTTYLAKDLIIPRYATVELLDRPKRIETGAVVGVKVGQTSTIDAIVSGKKITS
jgi:hypothetical protein